MTAGLSGQWPTQPDYFSVAATCNVPFTSNATHPSRCQSTQLIVDC